MEFRKKISYTMANGKAVTTVKTFRNLQHFDNYYNKLIKAGCNVSSMERAIDIIGDINRVAIQDEDFYKRLIGKF